MFENLNDFQHLRSIADALDSESTLPNGVKGDVTRDDLVDAVPESKPAQASGRKDQAVVLARVEFLEPGDHIPAHILELKMREVMAQLGQPAQGTGTNH